MWGRRREDGSTERIVTEEGREEERPLEGIVVMSRPRYNQLMGGVMQPK